MVLAYLAAGVVAVPLGAAGEVEPWLPVHLLLLGAATNAIVIWTRHFTGTLLRARDLPGGSVGWRLVALNVAVLGVLGGVSAGLRTLSAVAAAATGAVICAHLAALVRTARIGLGGPYAPTVRFYWVAAGALLAGVAAGTALVVGVPNGWYARVYAAHVHLNLFGWVSLAVLGTEFTLWPTVLRTRISGAVSRSARRALVGCTVGLALAVAGLLVAARPLVVVGLFVYLAGVVSCLVPFVSTARRRPPRTPAAWMLATGTAWLLIALLLDLVAVLAAPDPAGLAGRIAGVVPWLLTGFVAQVLAGALTYLLPVVLGGGPALGRRTAALLERWGRVRTVALNAGIAVVALPLPAPAALLGWTLALAALASFVVLAAFVVATTGRRARR